MATIVSGKHKGVEVKIHQFCNDWFHIEHENISNQDSIVSPTRLEFTKAEVERIKNHKHSGTMFQRYEWNGNRLKKKKFSF